MRDKRRSTKRKRAEEALRKSEARYRALIESQSDLVSRYRPDTTLTFVNDAYCRFYGKSREELIGRSFMFMVAPEFREVVSRETQELAKTSKRVVGEYLNFTQDGEPCWIQWIVQRIADESTGLIELQAVGRDVTQLKNTQEALRQAMLVVENSPVVVFRRKATEGWPVEYVSENVVQFGYTPDSVLTGRMSYTGLIHPDDRSRVVEEVKRHAADGIDRFQQEYRVVTRNGLVRWVDDRTAIERDGKGRITCYQGIVLDITERKRALDALRESQNQLQQAMKMEAVGRLAGGIAHDFNNLLTAIIGNSELARAALAPTDSLVQHLDEIDRAAKSAASLTRQLLAFSRRQLIEPQTLNLNDLVADLRRMLVRLIGEDVALEVRAADDLGLVRVDPGQFEQVLVNLAVNARDAMPKGGALVIETGNADVDEEFRERHSVASAGAFVTLSVTDTGLGMSDEVKQHLFEPFFTTKPKGHGTGLGLATIFGIVKQAGGAVDVRSDVGAGTTVKIYLPRTSAPLASLAKVTEANGQLRGSETVLLVEDDTGVRELATLFLSRYGYSVLVAANGGEALGLAENHGRPIDLLLTDVVMPGMNGLELAEQLHALHPKMKVLFCSGYAESVIVHHGIVDDQLNFIGKPYGIEALAEKVRSVLEER